VLHSPPAARAPLTLRCGATQLSRSFATERALARLSCRWDTLLPRGGHLPGRFVRSCSPLCPCFTPGLPQALLQPAGAAQACAAPLRWASSVSGCGLYACCEDNMPMCAHQCHACTRAIRNGPGQRAQRGTQQEPLSALARRRATSGRSGRYVCWQCMRSHARRPPDATGRKQCRAHTRDSYAVAAGQVKVKGWDGPAGQLAQTVYCGPDCAYKASLQLDTWLVRAAAQ